MSEVRIDKFLWAMRIYKTRSIAADACKNGRITMNGIQLKPSRTFHVGDTFSVRKGPITYTYRILQLCQNRLGAKLVPEYILSMGILQTRILEDVAMPSSRGSSQPRDHTHVSWHWHVDSLSSEPPGKPSYRRVCFI